VNEKLSKENFRTLFETASTGILIIDKETNIILANKKIDEIFHYAPGELTGRKLNVMLPERFHEKHDGYCTTYFSHPEIRPMTDCLNSIGKRKDGSEIFLDVSLSYCDIEQGHLFIAFILDITEKIKIEKALKESEIFLEAIVNALPSHTSILNSSGKIISVNRAWCNFADTNGLAWPDYGRGRNYIDICDRTTGPDSDIAGKASEGIRQVISGQKDFFSLEYTCHSPCEKRYFIMKVIPYKNTEITGVIVAHENITGIIKSEEALRESEEKFRTLFESAPLGIMIVDMESHIIQVNDKIEEFFNYNRSDLIGKKVEILVPERFRIAHAEHIRNYYKNPSRRPMGEGLDIYGRRKDGSEIPFAIALSHIKVKDAMFNIVFIDDITELREKEKEKEQFLKIIQSNIVELNIANRQLEKASTMKDEFLANMSHELRTPLNAILGMSETLLEETYGPLNTEQEKSVKTIEESGKHLLSLINDILDLSKIEAGKFELQPSSVKILPVCKACLAMIKQQAHKKHLQIITNFDSEVIIISTDERRLKQILVNLLNNAVKFTEEGGKIGLEVLCDRKNNRVNFTVWDEGIGIAEEDVGRLFKPFTQIDSRLSRRYEGTGLGLALVARLTELLGGMVSVKSVSGKGSRFTVTLPLEYGQKEQLIGK